MALTITQDGRASHSGNTQTTMLTVTWPDYSDSLVYGSGSPDGESFNADNYGLGRAVAVTIDFDANSGDTASTYLAQYDATNKKIRLFYAPALPTPPGLPGAFTEYASGGTDDFSALTATVTIVSRR